jgi:uncharacterized membrane protein (DUF485 family)
LEGKCNQPQLTQLNSFSKSTLKWENQLQVKDKFMNFNQCPITLLVTTKNNFCILKDHIYSPFVSLFEILSKHGNFTKNYLVTDNNEISEGSDDPQVLIREGNHFTQVIDNFHLTTSHAETIYGFVVSSSESYTSYEKLLMPFDELIWIYLILTFGFSFGFIFLIKRYATVWIQNAIFGEGVSNPAFNLLGMFFGVGQIRVPVENSARIILSVYLFFVWSFELHTRVFSLKCFHTI